MPSLHFIRIKRDQPAWLGAHVFSAKWVKGWAQRKDRAWRGGAYATSPQGTGEGDFPSYPHKESLIAGRQGRVTEGDQERKSGSEKTPKEGI